MDCPFPIWAIYITTSPQNPGTTRPGTFREAFWKGRTIVCVNDSAGSSWLREPESTWGSAGFNTVQVHNWEGSAETVVSNTSFNYQPSITAYIRKRVASTNNYNPFNIPDAFTPTWNVFPKNVIIDPQTMAPQQPNPYEPL